MDRYRQEEKRKIIMVIEGTDRDRETIKISRIYFDDEEQLSLVTFEIARQTQRLICDALGEFVPTCTEFDVVTITLDVPRIRRLVAHFADQRTPRSEQGEAIFNRMIVILDMFRGDLL